MIFSIILFLTAVIGGFLIYTDNSSDLNSITNTAAGNMTADFSKAIEMGLLPKSEMFRKLVDEYFLKYPSLLSLAIFSSDGGIFYFKTISPGIVNPKSLSREFWQGEIQYSDKIKKEIFQQRSLNCSGLSENLQLEAIFGKTLTTENYSNSLIFFFLLTGLVILTIFAMVFSDSFGPETIKQEDNPKSDSPFTPSQPVPDDKTVQSLPPVPQEKPAEKSPEKGNFCMYSETTGLQKQDLLLEKLDQELIRSASFDQDLVLMIFSFEGLDNETIPTFQKIVKESFPYKDLVFEYKEKTFAVLLPNEELEESVSHIENFQDKIERGGFSKKPHFSAGVSSRSGRLLKGERLLLEADRSHQRAAADPDGGILLFRISPRKYRDIVSGKS